MERDMADAEKKIDELAKENQRFWEKAENADEPFFEKIMGFCNDNPAVIMTLIDKLGLGNIDDTAGINNTQRKSNDS
ncbi:MAG: hypothetical protein AAGA77_02540 [Bacteroidota bacterium]